MAKADQHSCYRYSFCVEIKVKTRHMIYGGMMIYAGCMIYGGYMMI